MQGSLTGASSRANDLTSATLAVADAATYVPRTGEGALDDLLRKASFMTLRMAVASIAGNPFEKASAAPTRNDPRASRKILGGSGYNGEGGIEPSDWLCLDMEDFSNIEYYL